MASTRKDSERRVTALIPMKGHSERVPGKNLLPFCGKPLFHRIVESLQASRLVTAIAIDTDSDEIAENASKHFSAITVIRRPESLQGDFVPVNEIIGYDLDHLEGEHFLQTHCTNPLLRSETIDRAVATYLEDLDKHDSLFSATRIQTRLYWQDGRPVNHDPKELLRTQDLPPLFEENSNLYVFSRSSFGKAGRRRIGLRPGIFEMDKIEAVDIDEQSDFLLAELLFPRMESIR